MENKFDSFINSLNDHELAIYIGYQYESLLTDSKEKIKKEIISRGLTKKMLEDYLITRISYPNQNNEKQCVRCGSNKFFSDVDIEYTNGRFSTHVFEVVTDRCRLCYLNPSKEPPKNFLKWIIWYLVEKNKSKTKTYIKTLDWFE